MSRQWTVGAWAAVLALLGWSAVLTPAETVPQGDTTTDWADCLSCHADPLVGLPTIADLRPALPGGLTARDCSECHDPLELLASVTGNWSHPVRPVGSHIGCTLCHPAVPHGADAPPPLPVGDYRAEGCYECHRPVSAERRMTHAHRPSSRLQCRDCHPAHAPLYVGVPTGLVPVTLRQTSYDYLASNAACLACHPQSEIMFGLNDGFVERGTVNHHDLHVIRGQSLCIECHTPHGSPRPAMLRENLLGGGAMIFRPEPDGGTCTTLCHGVEHFDTSYRNR